MVSMTHPTVAVALLLDPRWPSQISIEALARLRGHVTCTAEIPVQVRTLLSQLVPVGDQAVLVSTDGFHPEVQTAIAAGVRVIEVPSRADAAGQAVAVMGRALRIGQWERQQTHHSLVPYLREETDELIEVIDQGGSDEELKKELGDVLLQVLFHAEIAARRGAFDFQDVCAAFVDKLRRRAPYLFDGTTEVVSADTQEAIWQAAKRAE